MMEGHTQLVENESDDYTHTLVKKSLVGIGRLASQNILKPRKYRQQLGLLWLLESVHVPRLKTKCTHWD